MIPQIVRFVALAASCSAAFALQQPATTDVIPSPRSALAKAGSFSVSAQTRIILGDGATETDRALARRFADFVERRSGRRLSVTDEGTLRKLTKGSIYLATPASDFARPMLADAGTPRLGTASPDEYLLNVGEESVALVARSERGRFYAMMTLMALVFSEGRRLMIPSITIRDWPDRPVRGFTLSAQGVPTWEVERLRQLLPLCGSYKLSTLVVRLPADGHARTRWAAEMHRLRPLAAEHWVEIRLDSSWSSQEENRGVELRLGFLPPGPDLTASIALAVRRDTSPPGPFLPTLVLEEPASLSGDWLEYCAAWIAMNSWSQAQVNLGSFNRSFFRGHLPDQQSVEEGTLFACLQNCPDGASWEELWVRPALWDACPHRVMRRHTLESLTANPSPHPRHEALSVRVRFLQFIAARLKTEDVLAESVDRATSSPLTAVRHVLECLDHLESALLDANAQRPVSPGFLELVAATAFQRRHWSEIRERLEAGQAYGELLRPPLWMSPAGQPAAGSGGAREFRRRLQCPEPPVQAKLVLSSSQPVVVTANETVVGSASPFSPRTRKGHPPMRALELAPHLIAGENLIVLCLQDNEGRQPAVSAVLEIQFRNGGTLTIGVDSLWRSRTVPGGGNPGPPEGFWENIVLTERPVCQP